MVDVVERASRQRLIAIDTSTLQRTLAGLLGPDTRIARAAIEAGVACLPPAVLAEALSDPMLDAEHEQRIREISLLDIQEGYWTRTGLLRRALAESLVKAKLPDCLIAQSCIDHDVPLITYDRDFRHFTRAGLTFA